jgi:hypothetical protein
MIQWWLDEKDHLLCKKLIILLVFNIIPPKNLEANQDGYLLILANYSY